MSAALSAGLCFAFAQKVSHCMHLQSVCIETVLLGAFVARGTLLQGGMTASGVKGCFYGGVGVSLIDRKCPWRPMTGIKDTSYYSGSLMAGGSVGSARKN